MLSVGTAVCKAIGVALPPLVQQLPAPGRALTPVLHIAHRTGTIAACSILGGLHHHYVRT